MPAHGLAFEGSCSGVGKKSSESVDMPVDVEGDRRSSPELSVCIVTHDSRDIVRPALDSVRRVAADFAVEIIVVDNDSGDDTRLMIATEYPEVVVMHNDVNLGYAPAMNVALQRARGEFVLTLSHDGELKPGAVAVLLSFMQTHPEVGLAGPRTIDADGQVVTTLHHPNLMLTIWTEIVPLKSWLRRRLTIRRFITALWPNSSGLTSDYGSTHKAPVLDGGCLVISRRAIQAVGLLDEKLMQGPDDYDLCFRMNRAGLQTWYVAESEIVHRTRVKEDLRQLTPRYLRTLLPQLCYMYSKYHGRFRTTILCVSAYLLSLKLQRSAKRLYGMDSVQVKALQEASFFCLRPERYAYEYKRLWLGR